VRLLKDVGCLILRRVADAENTGIEALTGMCADIQVSDSCSIGPPVGSGVTFGQELKNSVTLSPLWPSQAPMSTCFWVFKTLLVLTCVELLSLTRQ
jgi:hypothetical protein